jgi:putative acetyltransferase
VRPENDADVEAVHRVHAEAFARPGSDQVPPEAPLTDQLRASSAFIPAFSLVAEEEDAIVGHVIVTRATVGEAAWPVLGLGPLGVLPSHQGRAVGTRLMRTIIDVVDAHGEPMIVLLGAPAYYGRFGFLPSSQFGIEPPEAAWGDYFQVRAGATYDPIVRGLFAYAEPFDRL